MDDYLYDPATPPAEDVVEIERRLQPLRYQPRNVVAFRKRRRLPLLAAAAAVVLVLAGAAWLWTWPSGRSWKVEDGPMARLAVGETVQPAQSMLVRVARIGWMRVTQNSTVTLESTSSNRHRLAMSSGAIRVSVWAPPRSITIRTPAGDVIDLGCEFVVRADEKATSVDVVSGWVQLDNGTADVLVPGGAFSEMQLGGQPSVPVFHSATPEFRSAARTFDVETLLRTARRRDVLTLLMLARRHPQHRDALLVRAQQLYAPKSEETVLRARAGHDDAIWGWVGDLPLPPAKGWVRNWRDLR